MKSKIRGLITLVLALCLSVGTYAFAEGADPFGRYEAPVTVTSVRAIPQPSLVRYPAGDDIASNIWTRAIQEKFNINVEYLWTVDTSQIATRISTMLASGQLPDFFQVSLSQMYDLYDSGLLQELGTVFGQYASDNVKTIYQDSGDLIVKAATLNGKQYGIPFIGGGREFSQVLFLREDWLQAVGETLPKTIDDVIRIAEKFVKNDPDGNGANDTWAFPVNGDTSGGLYWHLGFFNAYNSFPSIWVENGEGDLVYGSVAPQTKVALGKLHELYEAGIIDQEFITQTYWSIYEPAGAGKYGMMYGPYYIAISPLGVYKLANYETSGNWIPVPLPGIDGPAKVQSSVDASSYWVISKDCKNPEAVIKMLNYWYETFYYTDSAQTYDSMITTMIEGAPSSTYNYSPISSYKNFHNMGLSVGAQQIIDGKLNYADAGYLIQQKYDTLMKFYSGADYTQWTEERCHAALRDVISIYKDNDLFVSTANYAPPTESSTAVGNLYAKEMEYFIKIISGAIPLDDFDKFVAEWDRNGGKELTEYVNAWYAGVK